MPSLQLIPIPTTSCLPAQTQFTKSMPTPSPAQTAGVKRSFQETDMATTSITQAESGDVEEDCNKTTQRQTSNTNSVHEHIEASAQDDTPTDIG